MLVWANTRQLLVHTASRAGSERQQSGGIRELDQPVSKACGHVHREVNYEIIYMFLLLEALLSLVISRVDRFLNHREDWW